MSDSGRFSADITASMASAESVLAAKGRSFYWARHLLGTLHAQRATRLYHLCRYIDDLADEGDSTALAQQALSEAAASIRDGYSRDPVIQDGLALMHECDIDAGIFLDLIAGVNQTLNRFAYLLWIRCCAIVTAWLVRWA